MSAFFEPLGGGRYRATDATRGPWDPAHQHAGPPSALLTGLFERCAPREGMVLARVTLEILGAIPVAELEAEVAVERPGRSVELLGGVLHAGGRAVMRARAWRVRAAPEGVAGGAAPPPLPDDERRAPEQLGGDRGYAQSVEWRWAEGDWLAPGPAVVWTRLRGPVVAGEDVSPLQRVMAVADSGSGVSAVLDWERFLFINPELTVHVLREPVGDWVCLAARTAIAVGGAGVATSVLHDAAGPCAHGAQSLLVAPRVRANSAQ